MSRIADVAYDELEAFWEKFEPELAGAESLEAVAERFTGEIYQYFAQSVVLARMFATVDYGQLPAVDRLFVANLARDRNATADLTESTPVLSLLATRGARSEWNDRSRSQSHLGIPLISEEFVSEIPMISRLLKEINFTPGWDSVKSGYVTRSLANLNGVFYVPDARAAIDERGRRIIPATDFVESNDIGSVFGFGGSYLSRHMFITMILFCRDHVTRADATKFVPLIGSLKAATTRLINRGAFFKQAPSS